MIITHEKWDHNRWPNFGPGEFACTHTQKLQMEDFFLDFVQNIRNDLDGPLVISSGFRDATHPVEAGKERPGTGTHCLGIACDVVCEGGNALRILNHAYLNLVQGVGVQQAGKGRFLHLDLARPDTNRPRPHLWSYRD